MKKAMISLFVVILNVVVLFQPSFAQGEKVEGSPAKDMLIKSEVETAVSMLQAIFAKHQQGEFDLETAMKLGADLLRELRYGTEGYFWADTMEGVNVVLYGRKDVEGKNRMEAQDEHGNFYIKNILAQGKAGGGYVEYWFTKKGESTAQPKRSYVAQFEPFGWVIGTGYYP